MLKIINCLQKWISWTSNDHLPALYAWVSYSLKLLPGIRYGLATMAIPLKVANELLSVYHFRMLSFLGVNRNIKKEWRTIPSASWNWADQVSSGVDNLLSEHAGATLWGPIGVGEEMQGFLGGHATGGRAQCQPSHKLV